MTKSTLIAMSVIVVLLLFVAGRIYYEKNRTTNDYNVGLKTNESILISFNAFPRINSDLSISVHWLGQTIKDGKYVGMPMISVSVINWLGFGSVARNSMTSG